MDGHSAIAIQLEAGAWWVLSTPGCPEALNPADANFPELRPGLKAHPAVAEDSKVAPIVLEENHGGGLLLRLLETQHYDWDLLGAADGIVTSSLESLPGRQWSCRRVNALSGSFTVVNYLGMAELRITTAGVERCLAVEIVSRKLDYDTEFRQITEDIADFCQQLLLNWDAPTSLHFGHDPDRAARLMLERFLFLRSHLTPERLGALVESIQRRPNSQLVREAHWTPAAGAGSSDWLRDPARMARDWQAPRGAAQRLPGQVLDIRKEDSVDTAANRFIKFALEEFRGLCDEVLKNHPEALSLVREAGELQAALDAVLARPFFRQIGALSRLPLDNPTLQKRDGYREILRAWLLTQAAAMLAWDRDDENHHGPTRNVATLYEYWVFLQLHKILDGIDGVSRDLDNPKPTDDAEPFLDQKNGELVINLKRGKKTCAPFTITLDRGVALRLHLYYERTFQIQQGATDASSYSRQFKPDYTLAIFPFSFTCEEDAAGAGKIAYMHFDAKYRAENMKMIFGESLTEGELDTDKQDGKARSTYRRGDLLKMHTYNDAVRQTAGSYVLYPGSDTETKLSKFHEIVPGVGAFVLKPGKDEYRNDLRSFLSDVFQHQADQFTQFRHYSDVQHATVKESPGEYAGAMTWRPSATCVLIFLKREIRELCQQQRLVYCRAMKDDDDRTPIRIRLGDMAGAVLCPYEGGRASAKHSLPWLAPILSCEMLSREQLRSALKREDWPENLMPSTASAYLLFRLDESSKAPVRAVSGITPTGSYQAVSYTLRDLDACPISQPST